MADAQRDEGGHSSRLIPNSAAIDMFRIGSPLRLYGLRRASSVVKLPVSIIMVQLSSSWFHLPPVDPGR